ncbi:MAG: hypothetical protein ACTS3F_02685 [Phycisphaerales bacterium]
MDIFGVVAIVFQEVSSPKSRIVLFNGVRHYSFTDHYQFYSTGLPAGTPGQLSEIKNSPLIARLKAGSVTEFAAQQASRCRHFVVSLPDQGIYQIAAVSCDVSQSTESSIHEAAAALIDKLFRERV